MALNLKNGVMVIRNPKKQEIDSLSNDGMTIRVLSLYDPPLGKGVEASSCIRNRDSQGGTKKILTRPFHLRIGILTFFLLASTLSFAFHAWGSEGNIRVCIARKPGALSLQGRDLALYDLPTGRLRYKIQRKSSLVMKREKDSFLFLEGPRVKARAFLVTAAGGALEVQGRRYYSPLKIFPGPNGEIWAINELPMENYLAGLVNAEIPLLWPMEALKAQVVAARTYAMYQKRNRVGELFDVDSTVADQVYEGIEKEDERAHQAVRETAGQILVYNGNPIFSVYHACCGGRTDSAEGFWIGEHPYLKSIPCGFCLDSPHFLWNYQISKENFAQTLSPAGLWGSQVLDIAIAQRTESKRVAQLIIQSDKERVALSGKDFRRVMGYDSIRSTHFIVKRENGNFLFSGLGWGHGIGMCQWGARGMAEAGENYPSILRHYYPGTELRRLSP